MSSTGWRSAKKSIARLTSCRPTLMHGSPNTTSTGLIRAAGALARPRCRPFLTRSLWQRKNSWRHDHRRQPIGSNSQHHLSDQVSANTLKEMESTVQDAPDQQVSLTDPASRSMATSGRGTGVVGYNVQIAVDAEHHLIVAHEVINQGHDRSQLAPMALKVQGATDCEQVTALADRGYFPR